MAGALLHRGQLVSSASMQMYTTLSPTRTHCTLHSLTCRRAVKHTAWLHTRQSASRRERGLAFTVQAGWNDFEWSKAKIVEHDKAAEGLVKITVDMGGLAKDYTKGGQYIQIKVGDSKPAFYALASAPAPDKPVEVIVKNQGDTAEILCGMKSGAEIDVSPVMGKGFPIENAPPSEVPYLFIFATGTGVGPIKALIESQALQAKERELTRLYYGTFNPEMTAYKNLIPEWQASGVEVVEVHSGFGQGYVQDAFGKDEPIKDASKTGIILCGQPEMGEAVKKLVISQGIAEDRILTNF